MTYNIHLVQPSNYFRDDQELKDFIKDIVQMPLKCLVAWGITQLSESIHSALYIQQNNALFSPSGHDAFGVPQFGVCFALLADRAGSHWASCQPTLPDPCLQGCSLDYPFPNIILLSLRKRATNGSTAQTQRQPHLYLEIMGNLEKHVCYARERGFSWLQATALAAGHTNLV